MRFDYIPTCGPLLIVLRFIASPVAAVTVMRSKTFYVHSNLLIAESEFFSKSLTGDFQEAETMAISLDIEDPDLFGFFIEYLYRDRSILSREVKHYSECVTLARLYALGERLMAPKFKAYSLWRFAQSISNRVVISGENTCDLLRIACTEITERTREDPMRAQIFWYAGTRITNLQKLGMFHQLLCDIPKMGMHLCLWINQNRPAVPEKPHELQYPRFAPESEYSLEHPLEEVPKE